MELTHPTVAIDAPEAAPRAVAAVSDDPFLSLVLPRARSEPSRPILGRQDGRAWRDTTYGDLLAGSLDLSALLLGMRLQRGDRVALLSEARSEWAMALLGVWRSGSILVPLDVRATPVELAAIVQDARPRVLLVSEGQAGLASAAMAAVSGRWPELVSLEDATEPRPQPLGVIPPERSTDETAVLIYTSGTTGRPKGVEITLGNLAFEVQSLLQVVPIGPDDVFVSILPLHHLLELVCGLLVPLHAGARVCYAPSLFPEDVVAVMRDQQATVMIAVPLFLKLMKSAIEREVKGRGRLAWAAFGLGQTVARALPMGARRRLFAGLHERLGGRLRAFVCGGAPLALEVEAFFERLGIPIYQGYGLTEASPVVAVNGPSACRRGTVGRPLPGVRVRIVGGEILTAGPHVMRGYYNHRRTPAEVIDGAWLHTGDLGELDDRGFLRITGRLKNLIVLPGGRKVQPEEVEAVLARSPLVREVCVLGTDCTHGLAKGGEEVCAVVVPLETELSSDAVEEELRKDLWRVGQALADYKRPTRLVVRDEPLPTTTTRKVRRPLVKEWVQERDAGEHRR